MKTLTILSLAALLSAGTFSAFAQSDDNDPLARLMRQRAEEEKQLGNPSSAATSPTAPATTDQTPPAATTTTVEAPIMEGGTTNGIRLNFRNAPLDTVLNYLSAAAGFHIVLDATPRGTVTVISAQPMTKDEAVELLNSVLNKNGLAAIRNDQFLTIVSQSDRGRNFPVKIWDSDPASIPNNDEMVTQIIPIRFVEAQQLVRDLSSFVSSQATVVANEAGNSIVITDTQANIRHLAEIIKAIDSSAEGETQIRVFPLRYANPNDVATLLTGVFPSQSGGAQNPIRFGNGAGGGGPGGFRGGGGGNPFAAFFAGQNGNNSSTQNRIQKQSQVIAVADARTQSVVVTASKDLMDQIAQMMDKLDVPSPRDQQVYTVNVDSGDPQQILQVLQTTFPANTTTRSSSSSSSSQNSALQQRATYNINQEGTSSGTSFNGSSSGGRTGGSLP